MRKATGCQLPLAEILQIVTLFVKERKRRGANARVPHFLNRIRRLDSSTPLISNSSQSCGLLYQREARVAATPSTQGSKRRGDSHNRNLIWKKHANHLVQWKRKAVYHIPVHAKKSTSARRVGVLMPASGSSRILPLPPRLPHWLFIVAAAFASLS